MKSIIIQNVTNGYLVTDGSAGFGNPHDKQLYVYTKIDDLQADLPRLLNPTTNVEQTKRETIEL